MPINLIGRRGQDSMPSSLIGRRGLGGGRTGNGGGLRGSEQGGGDATKQTAEDNHMDGPSGEGKMLELFSSC